MMTENMRGRQMREYTVLWNLYDLLMVVRLKCSWHEILVYRMQNTLLILRISLRYYACLLPDSLA